MPSPGLTELTATTQRNRGGRKVPSHSVKQAKTMSAIAHGWKPTGEAADIPVKVAKEFHAADKGKKYGKGHDKKGYDRSGHHPGNPGFPNKAKGSNMGNKPEFGYVGTEKRGSELIGDCGDTHATQPHGKSIGAGSTGSGQKLGFAPHHSGTSMGGAAHCFPSRRTGNVYGSGRTHATNPVGRKK